MTEKELQEIVHTKNDIILRQTKRILMLEEKFTQLRQKYFRMKYDDKKLEFNLHR